MSDHKIAREKSQFISYGSAIDRRLKGGEVEPTVYDRRRGVGTPSRPKQTGRGRLARGYLQRGVFADPSHAIWHVQREMDRFVKLNHRRIGMAMGDANGHSRQSGEGKHQTTGVMDVAMNHVIRAVFTDDSKEAAGKSQR